LLSSAIAVETTNIKQVAENRVAFLI